MVGVYRTSKIISDVDHNVYGGNSTKLAGFEILPQHKNGKREIFFLMKNVTLGAIAFLPFGNAKQPGQSIMLLHLSPVNPLFQRNISHVSIINPSQCIIREREMMKNIFF